MNKVVVSWSLFVSLSMSASVLGACHHAKPAEDPGETDTQRLGDKPAARDESGEMVSPEKMDEVIKDLDRRRESVSRCLAIAVDNKELPRNSKGDVTLEIVIESGKAVSVKSVSSTLDSKSLTDCVISKVNEISFPVMKKRYETSYSYRFEAI